MAWDEASGTLTIGKREGGFEEMVRTREFRVRFIGPNSGSFDPGARADAIVTYSGAAITVRRQPARS